MTRRLQAISTKTHHILGKLNKKLVQELENLSRALYALYKEISDNQMKGNP